MNPKMGARLLTYVSALEDGNMLYVSSNCLPFKAQYEPARHSFHSAALKLAGYCEKEESNSDDQQTSDGKDEYSYMPSSDRYSTKGKKKSGEGKEQDHYSLLGLGHLIYLATEDQIKKSYCETALEYHPDKQASLLLAEVTEDAKKKKQDEIESRFKSIQEAYEILTDPVKRRNYDSTDEIPTDCAPQDFFEVFGPAFIRNGRWSVTQSIPFFGDQKTPIKEVQCFRLPLVQFTHRMCFIVRGQPLLILVCYYCTCVIPQWKVLCGDISVVNARRRFLANALRDPDSEHGFFFYFLTGVII